MKSFDLESLGANLIDGDWIAHDGDSVIPVHSPVTLEEIGKVPDHGEREAMQAAAAVERAAPMWSATPAVERESLLLRAAELMQSHRDDLARIVTLEQGKPLAESRGEIDYGISFLRWYAAEGRRVYGEIVPSTDPAKRLLVFSEPVGPTLVVTPGNDPFAMITRKGAPALAAGCPVIIKPHRETPFSAIAVAKLMVEAGLPRGVINVITTTQSARVCESLLRHPAIRHVTFTGSSRVGKWLGERAGGHIKGMTMELGGHAPFVVFEDADIELAVSDLLSRKYTNAGQTCSCPARMFLHTSIAEVFLERFAAGAAEIVTGDGMDPQVTMGPLQNAGAVEKVEQHVQDAVAKGAQLLFGGQRIAPAPGHFYVPTALSGVTPDMLIMREETFGPAAAFVTFRGDDELFGAVNHASYGLAGYCYTRDLSRAFRAANAMRCGFIGINDRRPQGTEVPMGGVGESGIGREGGHWGIEEFIATKLVSIRL